MSQLQNQFSWNQTWHGRRTQITSTTRILWQKFQEHVNLQDRSFLEIGTGTGVFGKLAVDAGAASVCLLDNAPNAIQMCREYIGDDPRVSYVLEDATTFQAPEKFDVVVSNGLIEHFLDSDLQRIIEAHTLNSRDLVVFLVPASPHFNDRRCQYPWALKLYGPQYPISVERMKSIMEMAELDPILIERFYPMYSVKLNRLFPFQSRVLALADLILLKLGIYDLLAWATNPLGKRFGGYMIAIGRVQPQEAVTGRL